MDCCAIVADAYNQFSHALHMACASCGNGETFEGRCSLGPTALSKTYIHNLFGSRSILVKIRPKGAYVSVDKELLEASSPCKSAVEPWQSVDGVCFVVCLRMVEVTVCP